MIGVLIFPDFQLLDAAGPISAFEIAARFAGQPPSIKVLAVTPGPVRSSSGVEMLARGLKPSAAITTLIVAGGEGVRQAATCAKTLAFVRAMAKRGIRVASVCSGAYILAEAGVLDGRRATTHWQRTRHFVKAYPKIKLEPDRIFVRDGNIWSSAGISAGIDLALAMAAEDFGDDDRAADRAPARALSPPQRRPVAILLAAGIEGAGRPLRAAAGLGARASRRAADGGGHGRAGRHELAAFCPRLHRRDRHHAVEGGGAACASRWRASACNPPPRRSSASRSPPAFAIRSGCAAPSSAPSASRRNRCAARRGRDRLAPRLHATWRT